MTKLLVLTAVFVLGIFSTTAWSEITLVNPTIASTGASNVMLFQAKVKSPATSFNTATFYYSNISANTESNPEGVMIYAGDGITPCDTTLNPNCHKPGDTFSLKVQSTAVVSGSPQMYLLYCATPPTIKTQIAASGCTIITQVPYTKGSQIPPLTTTWADICAKVAASNSPVTDLSANCTSASFTVDTLPLYLMADLNGSFTISSEVSSFALYIDSVIPQFSSSASAALLGLYDFDMQPTLGAVEIRNPMVDGAFPNGENTVGIRSARFYYAHGALNNSSYDPAVFAHMTPFNSGADFSDIAILETGGLQTGTIHLPNHYRYYFKAALVDMAGNIGYLTKDTDGPRHSAIPQ